MFSHCRLTLLVVKSEVAIVSLLCQIQQTKNFLLEVKTITKLPEMGLLSLSNLAIYIKNVLHKNSLVLKLKNDFKLFLMIDPKLNLGQLNANKLNYQWKND